MVHDRREVLHLFAGAGGGILGSILKGEDIIGCVEIEQYPREVLLKRQQDGVLPVFPIWDDVTTFRLDNEETREYIEFLKSRENLTIAGGFPCQDLSVAGKGDGLKGERSSLWFEFLRIVCEIRPKYIFVENSAALIARGIDIVLGGLAKAGYDARWTVLSAEDVGAPHKRERIWIEAVRGGAIREMADSDLS